MRRCGFTLIELLITIAIVAILASVGIYSLTGSQKSARDTRRKSDLRQYQLALEKYANDNNNLYTDLSNVGITIVPPNNFGTYNIVLSNPAVDYYLWTSLERGGYFVLCSNGKNLSPTNAPSGLVSEVCQ